MDDMLERLRRNPLGDWAIRDVEALCRQNGILCEARGGERAGRGRFMDRGGERHGPPDSHPVAASGIGRGTIADGEETLIFREPA